MQDHLTSDDSAVLREREAFRAAHRKDLDA